MPDNDDYGFWDGDRDRQLTGPIPRLKRSAPTTSRSHASTARVAEVRVEARPSRAHRPPNPVLRRVGAVCGLALLAIPLAVVARGSNNDAQITAAEVAATAPTADAALGVSPLPSVAALLPATAATLPLATAAVVPATAALVTATPATAQPAPIASEPAASAPTVAPATTTATTAAVISTATARVGAVENLSSAGTARPVGVATPVVETKRTCAIDYKVVAGDYWISIAKATSVKLADLLSANGAKATTALYPGRSICLPANATAPTTTVRAPTTTTAKPTSTTTKATSAPTATTSKPRATSTTVTPAIAAPATTAAPPANNYSRAAVEQIIRNVWPDDLEDEAVRIATRESNLIPTVRNSCCYGLFQIYFTANKASLVSWGIASASALYDPQVNAYAAYAMYLRAGGWGPWAM